MEDTSPSSSLRKIEKDCTDGIDNEKMPIINEDENLHKISEGAKKISETKKVEMVLESPAKTMASPFSPFRSPSAASTTMTSTKWLQTVISPLASAPSAELEQFLSKCDKDVTQDVIRRARIILEAIFLTSSAGECTSVNGSLMDNVWAERRRLEAVKLYYKVLHAMCRAEAQMLNGGNLTSLLTNERFHRCMLACSAELVLATHKTVTTLFPAVLERTGITSFDLSKVIESFIRHEESLPRELRRHLNSLEERLLESMVWEKGSSMYNSLTVARPSLSAEITRLELVSEAIPSLEAIAMHINISSAALPPPPPPPSSPFQKRELSPPGQNGDIRSPKRLCPEYRSVLVERNSFTSPVKDRLLAFSNLKSKLPPPALQSTFASPTKPSPGNGGETCAETAINVVFCKIVKLAAVRINGMVDRLQLSQEIRETVYRLFKQILSQRTSLFFNRHIDQIILCCFYGVAKICRLTLTFKEIICNYRKQPHCKPQVFRSVFVERPSTRQNGQKSWQDHVDIITFYNEVFIPSVKILLGDSSLVQRTNQGSEANNGECLSPKVSSFPSIPDMSPKKVSATHNIYVSPLRSSKMDALISHSSKSYYACLGESTHAFQSPSKDLTAINNHLNGGGSGGGSNKKLRGTLKFEEIGGLISDSMVANSLYLQNGGSSVAAAPPLKTEQPDT